MVHGLVTDVGRTVMTDVRGGVAEFEPLIRYHTFADSSVNYTATYGTTGGATVTMLWTAMRPRT